MPNADSSTPNTLPSQNPQSGAPVSRIQGWIDTGYYRVRAILIVYHRLSLNPARWEGEVTDKRLRQRSPDESSWVLARNRFNDYTERRYQIIEQVIHDVDAAFPSGTFNKIQESYRR